MSIRQAAINLANQNPEFARLLKEALQKEGKVFHNEDALKQYLKRHPKADPSKHSVRGKGDKKEKAKPKPKQDKPTPKSKGKKDLSKQEGFGALKGLSNADQRKVIERALAINEGKKPRKDVSKEKGFEELKDLTPNEQKKVIERALKQEEAARAKMARFRGAVLRVATAHPDFRKALLENLRRR